MATAEYASLNQRTELEKNINLLEKTKTNPYAYNQISNKRKFDEQLASDRAHLEKVTPPDLSADHIAKADARINQLANAWTQGGSGAPPAPTRRQMEQAPVGAVGQYNTHDRFWKDHTLTSEGKLVKIDRKKQQGLVWELKDLLRMRHKDQEYDNPDVANLEQFRPDGLNQVPLADSILPMRYGFTGAVKANYDSVFGAEPKTPVEAKIAAGKAEEPKEHVSVDRQCTATKVNGEPCTARAKPSGLCIAHSKVAKE